MKVLPLHAISPMPGGGTNAIFINPSNIEVIVPSNQNKYTDIGMVSQSKFTVIEPIEKVIEFLGKV